jgi:U3 small nucleolar RNA-associated protein 19
MISGSKESSSSSSKDSGGLKPEVQAWFGVHTYKAMLESLLSLDDIDIDILLMLREEVFSKPDCSFYTLLVIRNLLKESSISSVDSSDSTAINASTILVKNSLDILRFIAVPQDETELSSMKKFLVGGKGSSSNHDGLADDESSGDDEEDDDDAAIVRAKSNGRKGGGMKRVIAPVEVKRKKRTRISRLDQLISIPSHRKVFSKAWLALLSMPLSNAQHKIILKHLPEFVTNNITQPLLLADYLTQSYEQGGVIAVLALESLFQLIVKHNLDYPNFFASLFRLCNHDVLSSKYRSKFMKLLTMCLRSANIPAYIVAAFAKRLSQLSLRVPSPSALFCVAQVTWLLRNNPQCMVLVHRHLAAKKGEEDDSNTNTNADDDKHDFDPYEVHDLEKCNAIYSSLWEMETLSAHSLHTVSTFAKALQGAPSTSSDIDAPSLIVEDFIEHTYASLMEAEASSNKQKKNEKNTALAFKEPVKFLGADDVTRQCFGSL